MYSTTELLNLLDYGSQRGIQLSTVRTKIPLTLFMAINLRNPEIEEK